LALTQNFCKLHIGLEGKEILQLALRTVQHRSALLWTFYWPTSDIDNWFKYAVSIRSVSIRSDPIRRSECNVWWRYCVTVLRASNVSIRSPAAGTSKSPENLPRTAPAHLDPPGDLKLSLRLRLTRSSGRQCKLELSTNWFYQRNLCK